MVLDTLNVRRTLLRVCGGPAALLLVATLSGCGVTLRADHVDIGEPESLLQPGIYYALPRTELQVKWTAQLSQEHGGGFKDFQACVHSCRAIIATYKSNTKPGECVPVKPEAWKHKFLAATVSGMPRPDPAHVYRVSASAGNRFATVNHSLSLSDFGTLTQIESSATEGASELIANVVGAALRALPFRGLTDAAESATLAAGMMSAKPGGAEAALQQADRRSRQQLRAEQKEPGPCEWAAQVSQSMGLDFDVKTAHRLLQAALEKNQGLNCVEVDCVTSVLDRLGELIKTFEALQLAAAASANSPEQAQITVALLDRRIQAAAAARQALEAALILQPGSPAANVVATWVDKPFFPRLDDTTNRTSLKTWSVQPETGSAIECSGTGQASFPAQFTGICTALTQQSLAIEAAETRFSTAAEDPKQPNGGGYRYRIPALANVHIHQGPHTGPVLARKSVPVAQFGPIVALPARYTGRKAALNFELNDQGALRTIQLGQEAQTGAALSAVAEAVDERRGRRAERAEAAQAAPLQNAQRNNEIQAEAIRALQLQRCAEALRDLPPDAPMPAICP